MLAVKSRPEVLRHFEGARRARMLWANLSGETFAAFAAALNLSENCVFILASTFLAGVPFCDERFLDDGDDRQVLRKYLVIAHYAERCRSGADTVHDDVRCRLAGLIYQEREKGAEVVIDVQADARLSFFVLAHPVCHRDCPCDFLL
jgi:hypothetical protein